MTAISPAIGLVAGLALALLFRQSDKKGAVKAGKFLLQIAVVLLGFQLQIATVFKVGRSSIPLTAVTISAVLLFGFLLGRLFRLDQKLSTLISSGTAICGGSAIAAIAPAIQASATQIAVSMGIVFILNAVALLIFPPLGKMLHMSQQQFGLWAAIAIHDTSSVVGATVSYGQEAAAIGTTVKLTRALWILPLAFVMARMHKSAGKARLPYFLAGFVAASLLASYLPAWHELWAWLALTGKHLMIGILFLVGLGLTIEDLQTVGFRPLLAAIGLWLFIGIGSLILILYFDAASFLSAF
ncbi:MAG: putative sulfate exporter family transporter [Leptospiraceae bacterium]|nr:putative sulfate exporter family transporter [Leptospiraceae bacterium]